MKQKSFWAKIVCLLVMAIFCFPLYLWACSDNGCGKCATLKKVEENFAKSEDYNAFSEEAKKAISDHFKKMVGLLHENKLLDEKPDVLTYLKFKYLIDKEMLESRLIYKVNDLDPAKEENFKEDEALSYLAAQMAEINLKAVADIYGNLIKDDGRTLKEKLSEFGTTEEELAAAIKSEWTETNQSLYSEGFLTFRKLIETQPELLLMI